MKIKKHSWTTFLITGDNTSLLTDPQEVNKSGLSLSKVKTDVVLFSETRLIFKDNILKSEGIEKKVVADKREKIMEICSPGEFEIGGLMIRREIGSNIYIIDEQNLRIVYLGVLDQEFNVDSTKDLGDVDVLIVPIGDGNQFICYDKLEKVFSNIDPQILLPCGYKEKGVKLDKEIKTKEDFIKHFGFTNISDENYLNIKSKKSEREGVPMEVIFL
ncbi:MBL fold metallo-hydrolase [bacterium]|nr:MBL fold metallo-hydrolase [bacterium]